MKHYYDVQMIIQRKNQTLEPEFQSRNIRHFDIASGVLSIQFKEDFRNKIIILLNICAFD